jgi:hypothetical protein
MTRRGSVFTRQKQSGYYMQRILNLMPEDFSKIQSKELVALARQPNPERGKNGKPMQSKGIGPNTLFFYLDRLIKKGLVNKLPIDPNHPKEVYYTRCKNPKVVIITEQAIDKVKALFDEFPKEIERMIELELATYRQYSEETSEEEENQVYMDISQNPDEIEYRFGRLLLKKALSFIEEVMPNLKNKHYYIDSDCNIIYDEQVRKENS